MFLEFLASNALSHCVILNYISALKYMFSRYGWQSNALEAPLVRRMFDGIKLSTRNVTAPKVVFYLHQIRQIAQLCAFFHDPLMYRAAYLLAFYAFLRISNIAPSFQRAFDPTHHLVR